MMRLSGIDALQAKHEELTGSKDRFVWKTDPHSDKSPQFSILHPVLMAPEDQDDVEQLRQDANEGVLLPSEFREEFLRMFLGEDHDRFVKLCADKDVDAFRLLRKVLEEVSEQSGPTRNRSGRRSRR